MVQRFLELLSCFDWLSPIIAGMQTVLNGPSYTFYIPQGYGWSALAIDRLLRDRGIATWGKMIFNRKIMFTVRLSQAAWAQYLLQREGVPINNPLARAPQMRRYKGHLRVRRRPSMAALEASLDRLDDLMGPRR